MGCLWKSFYRQHNETGARAITYAIRRPEHGNNGLFLLSQQAPRSEFLNFCVHPVHALKTKEIELLTGGCVRLCGNGVWSGPRAHLVFNQPESLPITAVPPPAPPPHPAK
jgi:hypothetical protein